MFKWTKVMLVATVLMGALAILNTSEAQAGSGKCGFGYSACHSPSYCYTPCYSYNYCYTPCYSYNYCYTPVTYCYPTYTYCYTPVTYCYPTYTYCYQPASYYCSYTYCAPAYSTYCAPVQSSYCFPKVNFKYCW